jgi:hypothetical protein
MSIETIRKKAIDKVQLFLDMNNGDNKLQKKLGWGYYVVYRYLHPEEYFEEIVTFDDMVEAEAYLQSEINRIEEASASDLFLWEYDEHDDDEIEDLKQHMRPKEWDLPIRRGSCEKWGITLGLADAWTFVHTMPTEMALELFAQFFGCRTIPGYFEEH